MITDASETAVSAVLRQDFREIYKANTSRPRKKQSPKESDHCSLLDEEEETFKVDVPEDGTNSDN